MESVFAREEQYLQATAFYALTLPEYHMGMHSHVSFEIMYVTGGRCAVFCPEAEVGLRKGQFIFLDAGTPHRLEVAPGQPCSILNLEFCCQGEETCAPLSPLLRESGDFRDFWALREPFTTAEDLRSMGYAMKDLLSQLTKAPQSQDFLTCILFYRLLLETAYCLRRRPAARGAEYLRKAMGYIDQHFLEEISIPEIAAHVGIHKSYLQSLFTQMAGVTINTYLNQKRLRQAEFLLANSTLPITDVAFASGYNSRQHFAHTFEKFYGVSPSRYRRLHSRRLNADTGSERCLITASGTQLEQMIR